MNEPDTEEDGQCDSIHVKSKNRQGSSEWSGQGGLARALWEVGGAAAHLSRFIQLYSKNGGTLLKKPYLNNIFLKVGKVHTLKEQEQGFPGGPVVKTLSFLCRGRGFDHWTGN